MKYSIIEEMFKGDCGNCENIKLSERYFKKVGELSDVHKKLLETLNEEQKKDLQKMVDLQLEVEYESSIVYYKQGIKFGTLLFSECLYN